LKKDFWPFLAKQASQLFGKIRKFRENVVFSKVDKIGINRFGIKFQIQ
ncbi:hypothetical protein T4B_9128, partial [Trichinella pseudospiralis]